jgi:hypothetical protein
MDHELSRILTVSEISPDEVNKDYYSDFRHEGKELPHFIRKSVTKELELKGHMDNLNSIFAEFSVIDNDGRRRRLAEEEKKLAFPNRKLVSGCSKTLDLPKAKQADTDSKISPLKLAAVQVLTKATTDLKLYLTEGATGDYTYTVRASSNCLQLKAEWVNYMSYMVEVDDKLTQLIDLSEKIDESIYILDDTEKALNGLIRLNFGMKPVIPLFSKIPYVGALVSIFYQGFSKMISSPVTGTNSAASTINSKITQLKIKEKNKKLLDQLIAIRCRLEQFQDANSIVYQGLVIVDQVCPKLGLVSNSTGGVSTTSKICLDLSISLKAFNFNLDQLGVPLITLLNNLKDFMNILQILLEFNAKFDFKVLNSLSVVFQTIGNFLLRQLSVCVSLPCTQSKVVCTSISYPCGYQKCCRFGCWPCGIRWCSSYGCVTVPYISFCNSCIKFSINDIISGVMNVVQLLQDAITLVMKNLAEALNIEIPTFNIPGLPDLRILDALNFKLGSIFDILDFPYFVNVFTNLENLFSKFVFTFPIC